MAWAFYVGNLVTISQQVRDVPGVAGITEKFTDSLFLLQYNRLLFDQL